MMNPNGSLDDTTKVHLEAEHVLTGYANPIQQSIVGLYPLMIGLQEKLEHLSQKIDNQEKQYQEILSLLTEIKSSGGKGKRKKSELPEDHAKKLNDALCCIRDGIKQKLPDRPKFETPFDKARIQEFEKDLMETPKVQECFDMGILTPDLLHEKVLNCLGEQRRAPQRRAKYLEKKQKSSHLGLGNGLQYDESESPEHNGTGVEASDPHSLAQHNFITITSNHDDPTLLVQASNR